MKKSGKSQIIWKYTEIEVLLNAIERYNSRIDELMSELRKQNRALSESMSGSSKTVFEDSYLILHSHMIKLRIELENLIKKAREASEITKKQDEDIANIIRGVK